MPRKVTASYNLQVINPRLSNEWHPTKNGSLTPKDVTPGSDKKVWWLCDHGHEWRATVGGRNRGSGCPYCSGQKIGKDNNLEILFPEIAKQWHPTKNGIKKPSDFSRGSDQYAWWVCEKGHEWRTKILHRTISRSGCPHCRILFPPPESCLEFVNPEIAKQWHPTKNENLTPKNVNAGSHKKVWWICDQGHEWRAAVGSRNGGSGCPYCVGLFPPPESCLEFVNPEIAKQWHPTKNGNLTPKDVTPGSGRRIWWICEKGHEWRAVISQRKRGTGCPYCDNKLPTPETCLEFLFPEIAKQWHPAKNGDLTPADVTAGSHKKVWWICDHGHEWRTAIKTRSSGRECPYCTGRYLTYERSLEFNFPEISKELHPTKNVNLSASNLYGSANKKVWWKCKKGHEYQASVASRTYMKSGCPICRPGYSLIELRVYCELKTIFKQIKIREKMYGKECDVYLPNLKVAVEIDGYPWHAKKEKKDKKKTEQLAKHGIKTYRIRDQRLKPLSEKDIMFENYETKSQKTIIRQLINQLITNEPLTPLEIKKAEEYLLGNKFKNQKEFKKIQSTLPGPLPGKSLADHPELIKDWHYEKNYPLIPNLFSTQSHQKVWWKCEKGHEYKDKIQNRVNKPGSGCGPCNLKKRALKRSMQIAKNGKSIADVCPKIIKEWHPKKNGERTPFNVPVSSHLVAWWVCSKGHEYNMPVSRRTGDRNKGCPYCSNMRVGKDNNLAFLYKNLAKEWHPKKNGKLKPSDVVPGTPRKVWWVCPKNHEYETEVRSRAIRKTGCPHCRKKRQK